MAEPVFFETPAELREWFEKHHESEPELFIGYYKKNSSRTGISHTDAIVQALCFGWIDSIARRLDDERYQVRFTPRRKGSVWSDVNVAAVGRLTEQGLMHPAGQQAFDQRKPDRVATYSYEQPDGVDLDAAQLAVLKADPRAFEWWSAQSPAYRKAAAHWVVSAKREDTRARRLAQLVADSAQGRRVPPLVRR